MIAIQNPLFDDVVKKEPFFGMTDSLPTGSAEMTNEVVGFDIGAESIKCSVWTPGATSDILGSSTIIQNDASQYSSG